MTDNLGRDVGGGMNSQELRGTVASLAKGKVGEAKPFNKTASNQKDTSSSMSSDLAKKFENLANLYISVNCLCRWSNSCRRML